MCDTRFGCGGTTRDVEQCDFRGGRRAELGKRFSKKTQFGGHGSRVLWNHCRLRLLVRCCKKGIGSTATRGVEQCDFRGVGLQKYVNVFKK
jgi:hypothetical protein